MSTMEWFCKIVTFPRIVRHCHYKQQCFPYFLKQLVKLLNKVIGLFMALALDCQYNIQFTPIFISLQFFLKATQLESMKADYQMAMESKGIAKVILDQKWEVNKYSKIILISYFVSATNDRSGDLANIPLLLTSTKNQNLYIITNTLIALAAPFAFGAHQNLDTVANNGFGLKVQPIYNLKATSIPPNK